MPPADLPRQFDAFLVELPYPGGPSGGKHVAVVLSVGRFHAMTGRALVAGLIRPKGHQRYPSHVLVSPHLFTPTGSGRPLAEDRVVQLDQARTVPAPPRAERIGVLGGGLWDGSGCEDGYGLETAFSVHFQIDGYLERPARHGLPMRPVEDPGGRYPRGSVWRAGGDGGQRLALVSNETHNGMSAFVQGLEIAVAPAAGSVEIAVEAPGMEPRPQPVHLVPALRSVERRALQGAGRVPTSELGTLDQCLLAMIGG